MRIDGQVTTGSGTHTRGVPVPTKATPREGRGILDQLDTARAAREARTLRTIAPSTPDKWTNPAAPATTATIVTTTPRRAVSITHGSPSGAQSHRRNGEKPCEPCQARARTDRQRDRLAQRARKAKAAE